VFGGDWGSVLQTTFLAAAIILLIAVLLSRQLRARLKIFISKHFFNYKFDYREEWLRFTQTLSTEGATRPLGDRIVAALAAAVQSPGGRLWSREGADYKPLASSRGRPAELPLAGRTDDLVHYLERTEWIVVLDEYRRHPERYDDLGLPHWLTADARAWIIVPLLHQETLQGFAVLDRPGAALVIDWEVRDLLKTAGRQAAGHLAQQEALEALAMARQFESFNRLSACVVHDLKNLIAQLSLVVSNAGRHGDKPEFLRDAIATVDNAVARMNRLMEQLRSGDPAGNVVPVEAVALARETVAGFGDRRPPVNFAVETGMVQVLADRDRLRSVLGHLIQNALDATPEDGRVSVRVHQDGSDALIDVEDSGCGMDADFVRNRLFRPFDTTKGMAGMGIGAFESREYLRILGGDLEVRSQPRRGARFRMRIPLSHRQIIDRGAA
jgi:putative PEP-CTERM system histidine kinase